MLKLIPNIILALGLLLISFHSVAQDNVDIKKMVGFACYYSGEPTKSVIKVTKLLQNSNYNKISSLLTSRNSGEKFLAVIILQKLSEVKKYELNQEERSLILKLKSSDELVSVCYGCIYFDKLPMRILLSEPNYIGYNYWLDNLIKEE